MINEEIRRRIKLSVAAYAYEVMDDSIMSDADFDEQCKLVDVLKSTGNKKIDNFFRKHFDASTGQWIHKHPELDKISELYRKYYSNANHW